MCALALVLLLGTLALGPPAHADGPSALFYGFVVADANGTLPIRVRALSTNGTVCGAAEVQPSGDRVGFYFMPVATAAAKSGCPVAGELVSFGLIYGFIDDGITAAQSGVMQPGVLTAVHLACSSEPTSIGGFTGTPPSAGTYATMRWNGPSHTPIEQAIATLGFSVNALYHYNGAAARYDAFIPGAPDWASAYATVGAGDDVIVVRAR